MKTRLWLGVAICLSICVGQTATVHAYPRPYTSFYITEDNDVVAADGTFIDGNNKKAKRDKNVAHWVHVETKWEREGTFYPRTYTREKGVIAIEYDPDTGRYSKTWVRGGRESMEAPSPGDNK